MVYVVRLEDEKGRVIEEILDPDDLLGRLLPLPDDKSCHLMRYVDPYGDTVFNRPQMDDVLNDLDGILARARTAEARRLVGRLQDLARWCKDNPHHYIKFYGD